MDMFGKLSLLTLVGTALLCAARAETLSKDDENPWHTTVTVSRGEEHTFWIKDITPDSNVSGISVEGTYTYTDEWGQDEGWVSPFESTSVENSQGGYDEYVLLMADDWEDVPSSVKSVKFVVTVDGWYDSESPSADNKFSFGHSAGRGDYPGEIDPPEPTAPPGSSEDNPKVISCGTLAEPKETECDSSDTEFFTGVFYISASLKGGQKYFFGVHGADFPMSMHLEGNTGDLFEDAETYTNVWTDCTSAYAVVPEVTGTYIIEVQGTGTFTFRSAMLPVRTPAEHPSTAVDVGKASAEFNPGYLNNPKSGAFDDVIDDCLFKFSDFVKGGNYVFRTEGADADLMMRLYDANGRILAENIRRNDGDMNVQLVWTATAAGSAGSAVYIGVCQRLEKDETPTAGSVTLTVTKVELDPLTEVLSVVPDAGDSRSPFDVEGAKPSSAKVLGPNNWVNTFVIAARAGQTYRFKGNLADGAETTGLKVVADAYWMDGTKRIAFTEGIDLDFSPEGKAFDIHVDEFANGTKRYAGANLYIDVYVADGEWGAGKGLDFGPYVACATAQGGELGTLTVKMMGAAQADMGWKIIKVDGVALKATDPTEPFYTAGASAILSAGSYTLLAQTVKGFATPDKNGGDFLTENDVTTNSFEVVVGKTATVAVYKYSDTADPLDDKPDAKQKHPALNKAYAPTKLAPTATKPVDSVRSLWTNDLEDWYQLTAKEGAFYTLSFTERSEACDAQVYVYGPDNWTNEYVYSQYDDHEKAVQFCAGKKGTYYACVRHADPANPQDSSYALRATVAEPGLVKLAKDKISAKENAASVSVDVTRSGKDGRVRLRYRTVADTAKPGEDYYPQSGEIVWEAGDNAKKSVVVKLIPDLVPTYEEAAKKFSVVFETVGVGELPEEGGEYIPSFDKGNNVCVVTLTEVSKADNGTVQVKCANPKKPEFTVKGGEPLTFVLERTGYTTTNATVEVTVDWSALGSNVCCGMIPPPSSTNVVWNAGDVSDKTVSIVVPAAADMKASKKGAIKLSLPKSSKEKVKFAAASINVVVENEKFAMTVADWAKALSKNGGLAVKEKKSGTWFVMDDGSLKNLSGDEATITFTVTGPCTFKYAIDGVDQPEVKVPATAKKAEAVEVKAGPDSVVRYEYVYNDGKYELLAQATQYGYAEPVCDDATAKLKVSVGKLPDGIKLEQDKADKKWYVRGVPTVAGCYYAEIGKTVGRDTEPVTNLAFKVIALRSAIGTFNGLATTMFTMEGVQALAQVQLTAPATGKLSAKVAIGGKSYQFKCDTGFVAAEGLNETNGVVELTAELPLVQSVTIDGVKQTFTNVLSCTVQDFAENDPAGWRASVPCELRFAYLPAVVKGDDDTYDAWYDGRLCRDNTKVAAWVAEAMKFMGYYTVALVPTEADDCDIFSLGNGYLTLTFDDKGKVKVTGALADGTAYSASSVPGCLGGLDETESVRIPLYACKGKNAFGGWMTLRATGDDRVAVAVFDGSDETKLTWNNDDPAATYDGFFGYRRGLGAVGGWYDTVLNLQRYYLDRDFSVDFPETDELDLLTALLPEGFAFVAEANPNGQVVDVASDNVTVEKQALVKTLDEKGKKTTDNDWTNSVNAANVKVTFKRATGILTGTCDLWYEGKDPNAKNAKFTQKAYTGCKHAGVLLWNRDDGSLLADDIWSAGAVVIPQTIKYLDDKNKEKSRKWNASFRFNVRATADPDKLPGGVAWQE